MGRLGPLLPAEWERVRPPIDVQTLENLCAWLARELPDLGAAMAHTPIKATLNLSVIHDMSTLIRDGDEIAFMPPMSGG